MAFSSGDVLTAANLNDLSIETATLTETTAANDVADTVLTLKSADPTNARNLTNNNGINVDFYVPSDASGQGGAELGARIAALKDSSTDDNNSGRLVFSTAADGSTPSERLVIDSSGKVGIGDTTPAKLFQVTESDSGVTPSASHHVLMESSDDMGLLIASGTTKNGYIRFGDSDSASSGGFNYDHNNNTMRIRTNGSDSVYMASTGYVGFNVSSPTVRIHLAGGTAGNTNSGIAAAWNTHSSVRWKTNVDEITDAVNTVKQLRPVTFKYKDPETEEVSNTTEIGFIAEELRNFIPSVVQNEEKDPADNNNLHLMDNGEPYAKGVDYGRLSSLSIAALKELIARVEALEAK